MDLCKALLQNRSAERLLYRIYEAADIQCTVTLTASKGHCWPSKPVPRSVAFRYRPSDRLKPKAAAAAEGDPRATAHVQSRTAHRPTLHLGTVAMVTPATAAEGTRHASRVSQAKRCLKGYCTCEGRVSGSGAEAGMRLPAKMPNRLKWLRLLLGPPPAGGYPEESPRHLLRPPGKVADGGMGDVRVVTSYHNDYFLKFGHPLFEL